MMISPDKSASRNLRVSRFPQPRLLVILLSQERMDLMVLSRLIIPLYHSVILIILLKMDVTTDQSKEP